MLIRNLENFELGFERPIAPESITAYNRALDDVAAEMAESGTIPAIDSLPLPADASLLIVSKFPPAKFSGSRIKDLEYINKVLADEGVNRNSVVRLVTQITPPNVDRYHAPVSSVRGRYDTPTSFEAYFTVTGIRSMVPFSRKMQHQLSSGKRRFHTIKTPMIVLPLANFGGGTAGPRTRFTALSCYGSAVAHQVGEIQLGPLRAIEL